MHRRTAALMLLAGLAACASPEPEAVEVPLRNLTVPLGGTSRFEVLRFAGDWQTLECLGTCADAAKYIVATDGVFVRQTQEDIPYVVSAPGVLRQMGGGETLVVMWVDEGFRTAAVGDAAGRWAAIIDRGRGAADRTRAAREVLDFNGWDVSQLRKVE